MNYTFIENLSIISQYKRPLAWITFIALVVAQIIGNLNHNLFKGTLLAFAFTILLILLDIHKILSLKKNKFTASLADTWPEIRNELIKALQKKNVEISWLGVTLGDAWPQLKLIISPIIKEKKFANLTLRLSQVHPEYLKKITKIDSHYPERTNVLFKEISNFRHDNKSLMTILISRYKHMPNYHGLLINNSILFMSHVRWDHDTLNVAEEPYERFDLTTEKGQYYIKLFSSWLKKTMQDDST